MPHCPDSGRGAYRILICRDVQSGVDIAFWSELSDLKLNVWRLSEEKVNMQGVLSITYYVAQADRSVNFQPDWYRHLQHDFGARHASFRAA